MTPSAPPTVPFPRVLEVGVPQGQDCIATHRALSRAGFLPWVVFKPYYTKVSAKAVSEFQRAKGLTDDGVYGPLTHTKLAATHREGFPKEWAFDAFAIQLEQEAYALQHPGIVCPVKFGVRPSFLHPTEGVPDNWALDWLDPGGTSVYVPAAMTVTRLSGRDPSTGVHKGDIFGWSIHFRDEHGVTYFATHLGSRAVSVGQKLKVATRFGAIGNWPHDPGRSHLHFGCDAGSTAKSQALIRKIAQAPRP